MDCIDTCHKNAIAYELRPKTRKPAKEEKRESGREENPAGLSRRRFSVAYGHIRRTHGTPCTGEAHRRRAGRHRTEKNSPPCDADRPGRAASLRNMAHHCTGCQLCVAVCPNGVLRPSEKLTSLMQPEMSYDRQATAAPNARSAPRSAPRSDPPRDGGRRVVRADRPCRLIRATAYP